MSGKPMSLVGRWRGRSAATCASDPQAIRPVRQIGEQALSRASGAPLVAGNAVRILEDADGNYPVWLEAIAAAKRLVLLENYILEEDDVGREFAEALVERARAGVRVRLVRDWLGSRGGATRGFWRRMEAAGVEVRCFNPLTLASPFGWVTRDHRKMLAVDGQVAFVTGLCISQRWRGHPARHVPPWRDTGLEIRGPAVADVEHAFAEIWETMGEPMPKIELASGSALPIAGDVALRVVAGTPSTAGLFRMDQLMAAIARQSLWLTDAYFVGITPYVQALRAAARDGVDVRLLVPNATDLPLVRSLSRAGYRSLLDAGVRIFEWNGSMLHAKTAVVDGRWSRIGSSNLNIASFVGNYELDVAVEDSRVAQDMEEMYLRDLDNSTEIVLARNRVVRLPPAPSPPAAPLGSAPRFARRPRNRRGSRGAAASAMRLANTVGAAVTNHRTLGRAEGRIISLAGLALIVLAVLCVLWPRVIATPLAVLAVWVGLALWWRSLRLVVRGGDAAPQPPERPALPESDAAASNLVESEVDESLRG
jgi:cardiolipin synthase